MLIGTLPALMEFNGVFFVFFFDSSTFSVGRPQSICLKKHTMTQNGPLIRLTAKAREGALKITQSAVNQSYLSASRTSGSSSRLKIRCLGFAITYPLKMSMNPFLSAGA